MMHNGACPAPKGDDPDAGKDDGSEWEAPGQEDNGDEWEDDADKEVATAKKAETLKPGEKPKVGVIYRIPKKAKKEEKKTPIGGDSPSAATAGAAGSQSGAPATAGGASPVATAAAAAGSQSGSAGADLPVNAKGEKVLGLGALK